VYIGYYAPTVQDPMEWRVEYIRAIGSYGSGPHQFKSPMSICIHRGYIHIVDAGNNRISVLTYDIANERLEFNDEYGPYFTDAGLNHPWDIAIEYKDYGNRSWVTDYGNARIVSGYMGSQDISYSYGSYGSGIGEFKSPTGIAYYFQGDDEFLYVCDAGNKRVVRLKITSLIERLQWDREIKIPGASFLVDIIVDDQGVYVLDQGNSKIIGLNHELTHFNFVLGNKGTDTKEFMNPRAFMRRCIIRNSRIRNSRRLYG